ncbi:MAG: cytochrome c4 [Methylococcales bacterium]|jgi:cytochrome c553|nr:cytochrome c4 [Methylococcales bacterium]HIG92236.1 cytochrome c4 [Methylococcaceae bacterium]MBT3699656.1 cytochrome c4 [Methylococcales bacterium]MBT3815401.1 cytochrome c4 [Methylococcales bacterium]MBT4032002.1 cytochrome c4 [Methylococcales bacterium]
MNNKLFAVGIILVLAVFSGVSQAKNDDVSCEGVPFDRSCWLNNLYPGQKKAEACAGCHGQDGNSAMALFPKLAGQHPAYLVRQLMAFKSGARTDLSMQSIASSLSDEDMRDIAAFYSEQGISANSLSEPEVTEDEDDDWGDSEEVAENSLSIEELIAMGRDLYRNGDVKNKVSACIACHGPYGQGNKPAVFPRLASQHADYLIKSLKDFKSDVRNNNPDSMMHMIAKKMSDQEIEAVAHYISMMKK